MLKVLETFRGLYVDLSGLDWKLIDRERAALRNRHPYLLPGARFIYSSKTSWRPPTQTEYDRREIEREQLRTPIQSAAAILGRKGGSVTSERKTLAVRENGKRGGRPRKEKEAGAVEAINIEDL